MIISMMLRRTPAQHARATLRGWTVGLGSFDIAWVEWDPSGPLSSRMAAMDAMNRLIVELEKDGHHVRAGVDVGELAEGEAAD